MLTVLTGRSRRLWPRVVTEIGEALTAGHENLLLLVPSLYTLQAELELVSRLNLPGFFNIDVLSPARLLVKVFALAGSPQRVRIDGRGKAMVLSDVLRQSRKELAYYGGAAERRGLVDRLSDTIGEFKRAGKMPEDVTALAEGLSDDAALSAKLSDIALVYARYEERLKGAFIDGEDAQEALLDRLPGSGLLDGARVWVYGFDLITPQFLRQISVMARHAESVRLALTMEDATARDGAAFTPTRDTLARLARHFDLEGLLWEREHVRTALPADPAIQCLERELFAVPQRPFSGDHAAIALLAAQNPYDEAMRVAERMLSLAREGMQFDEMAVVLGNAEAYAGAIDSAFSRSGIPYHQARNRPVLAHPLPRALLSALRCVTKGWQLNDALGWLKGGFCGLDRDEAERLENYAIENGLKGTKWRRAVDDVALDRFRDRFVGPLQTLQARLRDAKDTTETLSAVFYLLEDVDAFQRLSALEGELTARGLLVEAADCAQVWRLLLETLDQLHALAGGERMPMAGIAQVIEAGLSASELGALPAQPGAAPVGQLGHVKLGGSLKVLFLLGLSDGVLRAETASLLSDQEATRAAEAMASDGAFGLRGDALAQLMQVNLLDTLAAPSERLFISHALSGAAGEALRPAAVLKLIRRVFPSLTEQGGVTAGSPPRWHAPGVALDALGPMLREVAARGGVFLEDEAQATAWLLTAPETRSMAERVLQTIESPRLSPPLSPRIASALYRHTRTSVSRLETFAQCPFKHFVEHGLKPKPRRAFEVFRDETGTFYHRAMEGYTRFAIENPAWPNLERGESDVLMNEVLAPLIAEWERSPIASDAMRRASGDAFCRVARRAAWTFAEQMRRGGFRAGASEVRFGQDALFPPILLTLPGGGTCRVEGRIDRIDFYAADAEQWLCVVDYKSGNTTLDPTKVAGGLQLQLLLYLLAALGAYPGVQAGGAFYARLSDPLVETDSRDVEVIERLIAKQLGLRGIVLSDVRVLRALSDGGDHINKDGTVSKLANAASAEALAGLMRHAKSLAEKLAGQIQDGQIAAKPAQIKRWRACKICDYGSVCGFDPAVDGQNARRLDAVKREELLERVGEDGRGERGGR